MHTGMCVQRDVTGMAPVCVRKWELVCGCGLKQGLGHPLCHPPPDPGSRAGPFLCWTGRVMGPSWDPSGMWDVVFLHLSALLLDPDQASSS